MNKAKVNLVIDALLLLCVAGITGVGLLMKYMLIPGYLRWEVYGRNVGLYLWGLDRHQWGMIHLVIGLVFLGLLVLHVVLHWSMIVGIYYKLIPSRCGRWVTAVVIVLVTAVLLFFSYFVKPEVTEQEHGKGRGVVQCDTTIAGLRVCDFQHRQNA